MIQSYKKHFVYSVNSQGELCILIRFSRSEVNLVVIWSDPNWFSGFHSRCCIKSKAPQQGYPCLVQEGPLVGQDLARGLPNELRKHC